MSNADVGWKYSGNDIIGWSWSSNNNMSMDFIKYDADSGVSDMIASEPEYYITYINNIMAEFFAAIHIDASLDKGVMSIWINCSNEDGETEKLVGEGSDRVSAFLSLLGKVADYYWYQKCPSLENTNIPNESPLFSYFNSNGKMTDNNEVDIFEDDEGHYSIRFCNELKAAEFINKYFNFKQEDPGPQTSLDGTSYVATIQMMEGITRIYYNISSPPIAIDNFFYESGTSVSFPADPNRLIKHTVTGGTSSLIGVTDNSIIGNYSGTSAEQFQSGMKTYITSSSGQSIKFKSSDLNNLKRMSGTYKAAPTTSKVLASKIWNNKIKYK
jgi:hypothetical protein